jgi:hypothetical protein
VVIFRPRPLHPRGNSPRYPLDLRLGGPYSRSDRGGEEKILDLTGTQTPTPRSSSLYFFLIRRVGLWVLRPLTGLLYQPRTIGDGDCGEIEDLQGKPKYSEKTCPSATLSTTNPTCLDPVLNPGRRGGKPATNRLSYGAARPARS